ncbi:MAG: BACON domain-containing protein [Rikenellaceae bacterium]|nr:BACON domain-containing protein [Rikenellaceae bacterium]
MKHLKHLLFALPMLLIAMSFAGCNTEEVDPVIPELEIAEELTGEALESLTLQFDATESSKTFAVRCNRAWTAVSSNADWCVVNPDEGDGDNTLTVTVSRNTGTSRKAEIIVSTILFKRSIYIEQKGEQADAKVIFFDNLDGEAASKDSNDKWPYANEFQKYNKKGTGAAEVTYGSYSVTVRSNSPSNDTKYNNSDYSINEASGVNNLYFAAGGNFTVNKIALDGEQKLHMEWGVERNEYGNYDAPFNPEEFIVSLSADGQKWTKLTYTRSTYSAWDKASADFQLKEAAEYLYIKMEASIATRVDDIKLTTGAGGQELDLAAGEGEQEPGDEPSTDGAKLYYESFDGVVLSANTKLDAFETAGGFVRQGLGGAAANYTGTTFDFRKSHASDSYTGASGGNNAFGNKADVVFIVNNINVGNAQNIDLSMGLRVYSAYNASEFEAYYTTDGGTTYKPLTLTRDAADGWKMTTASFTVAETESIVGLKFVSKVADQQFRIDDLTLSTKDEGVKIEAVPVVKTADATDITMSGATIGGSYEFDGTISEVGVAYKAEGAADYTVEKAIAIQSPFSVTLNTLTDGTNYEYYAYVVVDGKEYKGDVKTFATEKDQSTAVTYFADDFAAIENNKVYTSGKWTFTSTDAGWPANAYLGWFGKTYDADKYINVAPYSSTMTEVVAYAVMTKFNVAEAQGKKLTFDLAWYFKTKDNSKFEVVASKNYTGDVATATWEVVESYTYTDETINPINTWTSYSLDLSTKYAEEKSLAVAFRYTGKSNTYRLDNVEFGAVEAPAEVLTVVTGEATNVTETSATVAGSYSGVTEAPAEVGVEYRMSGAADYTKVAAAAVAESFTIELSGLIEETTYEYRAYAVAGEETTYGEVKTFTTAAPATVTPIAEVVDGQTYTMEGTVTALCTRGFIFTDATGSILYYDKNYNAGYAVGQKLTIAAKISNYGKALQIDGTTATITEGEAGTYTYPTPTYADATVIDAFIANTENRLASYVALAGTLSVNGNYYNVTVDGTTNQGSLYYATDEIKAKAANGDKIVLYGYAVSISSGRYYNMVVTDVVKITDIANVELDGEYTMMGQVTALTSNGFVLTDATGSIFSYGKKSYDIGQELVATGAIGAHNKGFQLTTNKTTFLEGAVKAYTYPEATTADAAAIDAFIANTDNRLATYVTMTGDLSISGNYYNVAIEGTTNMGSLYYPNDAIKAALSTDTNITVKGYAMAVSGGKYYNVIVTEATTNYVIPKITPAATSMSFVAEGEAKTNELTVAGQGELLLFAKSSDEHFTAAIEGTTLTVTAAANTTTEAKSATVTVYMAESAEAEAVASVEIACSQAAPSTGEGEGEGEGGTTTKNYVKVTSAADLTDGKYLIVSESSNVALKDAVDAVSNTIPVTITDGKIASDATTDAAAFTLTVSNGALKGPNGKYIGQTSDANGMKFSDSAYTHTITFETSGDANVQSQGKAYLRYNAASDQLRFRYYKSSTYTKQKAIQLYKLVE